MSYGLEIGWDLVQAGSATDAAFFKEAVKADYVGDDDATYAVEGTGGVWAAAGDVYFCTPSTADIAFPDRLAARDGSIAVMTYVTGTADTAAIQYDGSYKLIHLGFSFENIDGDDTRKALMAQALRFFGF